ncbi:hypothetical protein [Spiroplasma endosymbiont of Phycita roborella]|uniref:hypothetical protein n=1 Tax=Spiroplasma endosymbiont of Phycita roborella TaxID=3066311 RepID=UPI00313A7948
MSKKRSKVRKKVKSKQKQFQKMNNNFDEEIVICQRKGCNNISDNIVHVVIDDEELANIFTCEEHADEYEDRFVPELLENIKKIENDEEINNAEHLIN